MTLPFKKNVIIFSLLTLFIHPSFATLSASTIQSDCEQLNAQIIEQNAQVFGNNVNKDKALMEIAQKPVSTEEDFDCFDQTNDVYQSMLKTVAKTLGEIFGEFWGSLFSMFLPADGSKGSCAATRTAISQGFGFTCPSTSIPYLSSVQCKGGFATGTFGNFIGGATSSLKLNTTGYSGSSSGTTSSLKAPQAAQGAILQRMSCAFNPANCK